MKLSLHSSTPSSQRGISAIEYLVLAVVVIGAIATAFTGPKVGLPLLLSGAAIGAFPFVVDSEYFSYIAGGTLALAAGLGIYWLWDRVRDSANAPYEPPQK